MIALDLSLENLYRQYIHCRRNKRNTINALRFEVEQEKNLLDLREALLQRTYRPGRSVCFFATRPKLREIFAADFRDRVVHHVLVDYLERIWEPIFIHDSYACRKGKGVHGGVKQLQTSAPGNGQWHAPCLVSNGVNFLGYNVRRDYLLIRRRVVNHLKEKLRGFESKLVSEVAGVRCFRFDRDVLDQLAATLSSYLGHFKLANSWNLWQSIWRRFDFLAQYFEFDAENWRLERKYTAPQGLRQVKKQYRFFRWRFPDDALFFRVGRFVEFYDVGVSPVASQLGLDAIRKNRRGARSGFPYYQAGRHLKTLLDVGVGVVYIGEGDSPLGGIRLRVPLWRRVRVGRTDYQDIGCSEVVVPD